MEKPNPDTTVAQRIDAKALQFEQEGQGHVQDVWDEHPDNQCFVVSSEEALVLDIDPSRWPRMHAAIRAFEACSDFCDDGSYPEGCWDEVYKDRPDIPMNMENVEAFAEFCTAYAGLSAEEAYRAWFKWEIWHFRMGYHLYPTCTNIISNTYRLRQLQSELERSTKTVTLKSSAVALIVRCVRGAVAQAGWRMTICILYVAISLLGLAATAVADEPYARCEDQAKACLATCGQGDSGPAQLCRPRCWSAQRSCNACLLTRQDPTSTVGTLLYPETRGIPWVSRVLVQLWC